MNRFERVLVSMTLAVSILSVGACGKSEQKPESSADKAAGTMTKAAESAGQAVGTAMEKAGDAMKEAGEKVKEGTAAAVDKMKEDKK
jgi:hypothetical protein